MSIVIATEIDIDATPTEVWEVLTDFPAYGEWSNFSKIEGEPRPGAKLRMRMPGMSFGSTITAASPGQKLEWAARIFSAGLFEGRHTFMLTPNDDGTTHLSNIETFSGALVWPLQPFFRQGAKPRPNGYDGFNQGLKRRVERRFDAV